MKKYALFVLLFGLLLTLAACAGPSGYVPAGQVVVRPNPNYNPQSDSIVQKYVIVATEGQSYIADNQDSTKILDKVLPYILVGQTQIGYWGDQILKPGPHREIPAEDVRLVEAANVPGNYMGAYCFWGNTPEQNDFRLLPPGLHDVPADHVTLWPVGVQVFRTLSADGSPSLLDQYKANPTDPLGPCGNRFICEASISRATLKDTTLEAVIDADVYFRFDLKDAYARRLCELRSPQEAAQAYVVGKTRGARSMSGSWTADEFKTETGQKGWQDGMLQLLVDATKGQPIIVESVDRRSVVIGSREYQQQLAEQEALRQKLLEDAKNVQLRLDNQAKEQELAANEAEFARKQALLDAENKASAYRTILEAFKDQPWQVIAVLMDYLQVNPSINIDGSPINPTPVP